MKIGHYMHGLFDPGGLGSYLRRVTQAQSERGHQIILFDTEVSRSDGYTAPDPAIRLTRDDADLLSQAHELSLDILHVHTPVDSGKESTIPVMRTLHGHHAYCPSGSRFLARQHMPCPRRYNLLGCAAGHFIDHCGSLRPNKFLGGFQRVWQERRVLPGQSCIAVSSFSKLQMERSGYEPDNVTVVFNPAPAPRPESDIAPAAKTANGTRFVFLGRIVAGKGLDWLIQAAARGPADAHFEIIGEGDERPRMFELTRQLGVSERFTWTGWLKDEAEISERLAVARAVIFPSLWQEPAGLVTSESAAAGRALIASRVGGIPEYAEKLGNAILVAPNDVDALAAAIARLVDNPDQAARLGRAGWLQLRSGTLSLDRHLDHLEEVYSRALAHKALAAECA